MTLSIPFTIPTEFAGGLMDGSIVRIGTVLKEASSGMIVAHVQETGVAQQVLSGVNGGSFFPLDGLDLASSIYTNAQLSQLKTMVEGLQVLQYANLGVAIAGIGISVMGFAMLNKRLKELERQVMELAERVEQEFRKIYDRELRARYAAIYGLLETAELAHTINNPAQIWLNVALKLGEESVYFRGEIAHLLSMEKFDKGLFTSFVRSLGLCNAGRVECLLLSNELNAAHRAAGDIGRHYQELFDDISPFHLTNKFRAHSNNALSMTQVRSYQLEMNALAHGIRDVTDAALTKPLLINTLIEKGIGGRKYVEAVRNEKEQPLLLFQVCNKH